MFSGIIDAIGRIRDSRDATGGKTLTITAPGYWQGVPLGGSIAVDGVCLTLTRTERDEARFDVIAETLRKSTLGDLKPGDNVNLQKSLTVGDGIDGHFVQGHVDAVAKVRRIDESAGQSVWWLEMPTGAMACVTPKGSIAIDGISLTIAEVRAGTFSVALIPTTLEQTTLRSKRVGSRVNIETDILARTVVHYLKSLGIDATGGNLSKDFLSRHGFS
jgi:riboflavin synthase